MGQLVENRDQVADLARSVSELQGQLQEQADQVQTPGTTPQKYADEDQSEVKQELQELRSQVGDDQSEMKQELQELRSQVAALTGQVAKLSLIKEAGCRSDECSNMNCSSSTQCIKQTSNDLSVNCLSNLPTPARAHHAESKLVEAKAESEELDIAEQMQKELSEFIAHGKLRQINVHTSRASGGMCC